ncbi:MAG: flagellar basal body P-ring protein FlgI, partial [Desulfobacterales bacterium]|nr:flagellar basal body P-ring protein FlgI [Desulfobacterales bacterium]
MSGRFKNVLFIVLLISFIVPSAGHSARIKDISSIKGIRQNQLLGYGLMIGLNGTGDKG